LSTLLVELIITINGREWRCTNSTHALLMLNGARPKRWRYTICQWSYMGAKI